MLKDDIFGYGFGNAQNMRSWYHDQGYTDSHSRPTAKYYQVAYQSDIDWSMFYWIRGLDDGSFYKQQAKKSRTKVAYDWSKQINEAHYGPSADGCGAVAAGSNCADALTPGQKKAQSAISSLDPTGLMSLAECVQDPDAKQCSIALAEAIPGFGEAFNGADEAAKVAADGTDLLGPFHRLISQTHSLETTQA
ncbi:hypothetical protein SAMN05216223_116109 [Actinacidiphila yanglinensis]|uniref:Uncharacterized protein n=1 Tax=Actinacidiphila yanglinensis TaxID=310779 RepID=A0A1H6DKI4_9ACTN|nr:hypothetical protein [Actinacidiphila yanglinensis]SEG85631.1 hypothetical protein SAMN05216223_116109 [Actinacidiphila yanglinensis]